jgi:hypothetical protein
MDLHGSNGDGRRQTAGPSSQTDHRNQTADPSSTAVQSGASTPDESTAAVDEADGYSKTPPGCNCSEYRFDLDDGRTVSRRSTKVFCPVHGVNESYRDSFSAHAAWRSARGSYRRCDVYHVTLTLHAKDVEALGVSPEDSEGVLSGLLPRLRKRLKRRDGDAEALLSLSPRPSDGEWHMHVLVLSKGCTTADVFDVFRLDGTNVCVTTPRSREENRSEAPMSAETFATAIGSYLFDNRIPGEWQRADTKFTAWGGAGYFSDEARTRRQAYAEAMAATGGDSAPARGTSTQIPTLAEEDGGETGDDGGGSAADAGGNAGIPPVEVGTSAVQSADVYRRVVIRALMARMHTEVKVHGLGRCKLTWVEVGDEGSIICSVRPLEKMRDDKRDVSWRRVESTDTPVVESANSPDEAPDMDTTTAENAAEDGHNADERDSKDDGRDWGASLAEKYLKNARHRTEVEPLPDGRRHVREWRDGEKIRDEKIAPRR